MNSNELNNTTLLSRGVSEVIDAEHLKQRLAEGKPLRVKLGIDPSKPDLHIGHAVTLRKLRQFQDAGHTAVLIIGDYTAQVGDPTDRSSVRQTLSFEEVKENARGYIDQAYRFLDQDKTEIHHQSEWYNSFSLRHIIELLASATVNHLLSHETFSLRLKSNQPLYSHELLYPMLQGYDSVMVKSDVEIGGTDQKFNVLMGRTIQRVYQQPEQDVVLLRYLPGTDGQAKMSKSMGNVINITDSPHDMFGKTMSIPDEVIPLYYELATTIDDESLAEQLERLNDSSQNPRDSKFALAKQLVTDFYDEEAAEQAAGQFERVFEQKEAPEDINQLVLKPAIYDLLDILVSRSGLVTSRSEARRLISQRGVKKNQTIVEDYNETIGPADGEEIIIQVGSRRFLKVVWKQG